MHRISSGRQGISRSRIEAELNRVDKVMVLRWGHGGSLIEQGIKSVSRTCAVLVLHSQVEKA